MNFQRGIYSDIFCTIGFLQVLEVMFCQYLSGYLFGHSMAQLAVHSDVLLPLTLPPGGTERVKAGMAVLGKEEISLSLLK